MKTVLKYALLSLFVLSAPAMAAGEDSAYRPITGDDLRALFLEHTMAGEYVTRRGGIKHYRFTEYHRADGSTDYIETDARTVKGRWKLLGDNKICYKYPGNRVFSETYCFFVFENEGCYYNYAIDAMTVKGPRNWKYWTSRAIVKGSGKSCAASVS